jgi:hypothetical protein
MTPQDELTLLEAAYTALLTGGVQSYSIGGRSVTKNDIKFITERMDLLRRQVSRQSQGMFYASQFRKAE